MAGASLNRVSESFAEIPEAEIGGGEVATESSVKLPVEKGEVLRPDFTKANRPGSGASSIS